MNVRIADIITLSSAALSTLSLAIVLDYGLIELGVRILLLAYLLDILDGIVARREGPTPEGFMLDRAIDRYNQVVVPIILLLAADNEYSLHYIIYSIILVPWGFYRLVYRRVPGREYFHGLPLLSHSLVITLTLWIGEAPNPLLIYILLAGSILPIPYYRRPIGESKRSPSTRRVMAYDIIRILPLIILISLPVGRLQVVASKIVVYAVLAYAITGYVPFLLKGDRIAWNASK